MLPKHQDAISLQYWEYNIDVLISWGISLFSLTHVSELKYASLDWVPISGASSWILLTLCSMLGPLTLQVYKVVMKGVMYFSLPLIPVSSFCHNISPFQCILDLIPFSLLSLWLCAHVP